MRFIATACSIFLSTALMGADAKWISLCNGKDLSGWTQRGGKAKYEVQDGTIVGSSVTGTPNSFLCTEKEYGDFILELEFRVNPALNSGVQIRSECFSEPRTVKAGGKDINIPAGRVHGYQVEIDLDSTRKRWWSGGIYDEGRRAWLFPGALGGDEKKSTEQGGQISKPDGWNKIRVEAKGDSIKTWLNGEPRAEINDGMTPRGFIALQVHGVGNDKTKEGMKAEFRNIRLQEISR